MKIKHWMTPDPVTVDPETLIVDAKKLMKDHKFRRLPVVDDKGRLVGIVTYRNIIEASPSSATSLSIHELNYLLLKLKVKDVMRKDPVTVGPEDSVIDVILMGAKRGIGSFPVAEKGKLIGIVTETEILRSLIQIFGTGAQSQIVELENVGSEDSVGDFRRIAEFLENRNIPILGMFALPTRDTGKDRILVRVKTKNIKPLVEDLLNAGYMVVDSN
jgi:acetoin utilization protein AcuB